jgi:DNA polymerase-2
VLKDDFNLVSELEIEFETHFSQFLMPTVRGGTLDNGSTIGTKKRYAGIVSTGTDDKLIFKGMETVRSDWTELSKIFQQELYRRVFNGEPVERYIVTTVNKTLMGEFDDLLIYRKRIRRRLNDYVKNVPPHVKAARIADAINKKLNKPLKYQNKGWIEYLITLNGPQPKEYLDSTLDYDFYVDRQLKTVANDILPFIGTSFEKIVNKQLDLF